MHQTPTPGSPTPQAPAHAREPKNRLSEETSPYLLQHAGNPVDWFPWSAEALERAREDNLPILLSIGYSACHWCHVMERESFSDPEVARIMNELFVSVKVDREERPDVDAIYMRAVQAMTGQGGWPLTVFLTPQGAPYYGGTYFPPEPRGGMPAFREVLRAASDAWKTRPEETESAASRVREFIEHSTLEVMGQSPEASAELGIDAELLTRGQEGIASRYDPAYGGFGPAPKFPQPALLEFLLRSHLRTGESAPLEMAVHTLSRMGRGGICDHVGGGFHRYSVDGRWHVPHFEKMLADNALLARIYLHAFQVTRSDSLLEIAESTLEYLLEDLRSPEGAFYSARDADSEGEEGRYYLWTRGEVEEVLGPEDANLFERVFDVTAVGNFEGRNVLHLPHDPVAVSDSLGLDPVELGHRVDRARDRLRAARTRRVAPARDEKIITGLNGLAFRAFAEAGGALRRRRYVDAAREGMRFLLYELRPGPELLHVFAGGQARIPGFLDDYAAVGNALLTLYEVTLEPEWLSESVWIIDRILERFRDPDSGLFFDTPADGEPLLVRPREVADRATPSGNALAAELFARASVLLGREDLRRIADGVIARERGSIERYPSGFGGLLSAADFLLSTPVEVGIIGRRESPATRALLNTVLSRFQPNRVVAGCEENEWLPFRVPLVEGRSQIDDRPTAYVCRDYACQEPVTSVAALEEQLG